MTEKPNSPIGGLPQNFNLGAVLDQTANTDAWNQHDAVVASQKLWDELNIDAKTGLLKQEAWMNDLTEAANNLPENKTIVVTVADLDGFKLANDTLGHAAGDKLLAIAGQAFSLSYQRDSDKLTHGNREAATGVARLGGDEYAVYDVVDKTAVDGRSLENATNSELQSQRVNETYQKLLLGTEFEGIPLRISLGSAQIGLDMKPEDAFAIADHNMFVAKYSGKIASMTEDDKLQLREHTLPHLRKIGARVESWLEQAASEVSV